MVDSGVEVEVWMSLSVRGKLVSFSSLGRFQDSYGIKKEVATSREDKYCTVGVGNKTFQFHVLVCTAFHGEKPWADHEAHHLSPGNVRHVIRGRRRQYEFKFAELPGEV